MTTQECNDIIRKAKELKTKGGVGSKRVEMSGNNEELFKPVKRVKKLLKFI